MSQINIICCWIHWISLEIEMHGMRLAVTLPCGHCYCLTKCKINKIYHFRMLIDSFYSVLGFQLNSKATHGAGHCYSNWTCGMRLEFKISIKMCIYFSSFYLFLVISISAMNVLYICILSLLFGFVFTFDFDSFWFWFSFLMNKVSHRGNVCAKSFSIFSASKSAKYSKRISTSEKKSLWNANE